MKSSEKRKISNEEFEQANKNIDNKKILNSFSKKYSNSLSYEEIKSCGLVALWKCLQLHDDTKQKFTTSLYRFMIWECNQTVANKLRKPHISLCDIDMKKYSYTPRLQFTNIDDIILKLDDNQQNIVYNLLNNKKIKDIAKEMKKSKAEIEESIKLIEKKVKDLVYD